jgi:phosphoserine aminotransferase
MKVVLSLPHWKRKEVGSAGEALRGRKIKQHFKEITEDFFSQILSNKTCVKEKDVYLCSPVKRGAGVGIGMKVMRG